MAIRRGRCQPSENRGAIRPSPPLPLSLPARPGGGRPRRDGVQASAEFRGLVPGHFRQELPGRGAKKMPAPRLSSGMPALPARLPPGNGQSSTQACPFPPDPEQYQAKACTTNKAVPVRSPGFSLSLPAVPSRSLLLIPRTSPRPGLASLREHCGRIHVRDKRPRAGQHIPMPGVASQSNR